MNPIYLQTRVSHDRFETNPVPFPSYHEAIIAGQETAGYGNFIVDTGSRVPTRREQLLRDTVKDFGFSDEVDAPPKRRGRPSRTKEFIDEL